MISQRILAQFALKTCFGQIFAPARQLVFFTPPDSIEVKQRLNVAILLLPGLNIWRRFYLQITK